MNSNLTLGLANDIKNAFGIGGETVKAEAFGNGNINDTYLVYIQSGDSVARYIFQRVNRAVFTNPEDIAKNVSGVTTHIANKLRLAGEKDIERRVVKYYRNVSGGYYHITENGDYWRVMSYIYDSVCFDTADNTLLFNTGVAFGEFQRLLSDFPAETLCVTIPDFHNTPARYAQLALAAGADAFSRLCEVKAEYDYLLSQSENACRLCRLADSGAIPLRVVHNDTKCNNVMFDAKTGRNLAVVDLDTVMPGLIAYDFGDAVRFAANPGGEDCEDLSAVFLDTDAFAAFARGYVGQIRGSVSRFELDTLADGVLAVTLELAARFLTDYLCGDSYFKCKKERHNLLRARAQIALARDIITKIPTIRSVLDSITNRNEA